MLPGLRLVLPCAALVIASSLAGCGSKHHSSSHGSSSPSSPSSPSTFVATRWWSNSAVAVGSTIDPAHPDAAAASLQPSQPDYCGMLKQTVAAGKSILPAITATDPALLTSTKAFVAELSKVAPAGITAQWQVLGPAVLEFVKAGGDTNKLPALDLGAITKAGTAISADSLKSCGVDLSTVTPGLGG